MRGLKENVIFILEQNKSIRERYEKKNLTLAQAQKLPSDCEKLGIGSNEDTIVYSMLHAIVMDGIDAGIVSDPECAQYYGK